METVLRDGLSADDLKPTGIYFGTRNGKLFGSADAGESWNAIMESLPPVVCVKAAVVQLDVVEAPDDCKVTSCGANAIL